MISRDTMRIVLTAANILLERRESRVRSIEWDIKMRTDVLTRGKSAGARTRAQNEIVVLQKDLDAARAQASEVHDAINELRATEVGAETWKELEK